VITTVKPLEREKQENRRMLFHAGLVDFETLRDWECFDAHTGKDSAREIREFFIPTSATGRTTIRIGRRLSGC